MGCGAIGCELLKLFALLGVGRNGQVVFFSTKRNILFLILKITITDHDHIEKSNLNRQFLFHKQHLNQPKSTIAAQSARDMNKELQIESYTLKGLNKTLIFPSKHFRLVGLGSNDLCSDAFISKQTIIVNALDNVEARRYMDSYVVVFSKREKKIFFFQTLCDQ